MNHRNPYRINDPNNIFELGENSSHHELKDSKRLWKFKAYTFTSATELESFFKSEGLNPNNYVLEPSIQSEIGYKKVVINVVHKSDSRNYRRVRGMSA